MQQSIESIKGNMISLDMDQMNSEDYVDRKSKEVVDKEIIGYFNKVHNSEVKIVHLKEKLIATNLSLTTAHNMLNHYLDMDQMSSDDYVDIKSKEVVDKEIIVYSNKVHNSEVEIVDLREKLFVTNLSLTTANNFLNHLNESYRKIQRPMPEKPKWEEVEQNDIFDISMRSVLDGSEETRSETAPNPYLVAGLSSGY